MRIAIIGSRSIIDPWLLLEAISESGFEVTSIVSGGAKGADNLAERYASKYEIPITVLLADWDKHGKSAGMRRNAEVLAVCDAVIALWDGTSPGTKNTIDRAVYSMLPVFIKSPKTICKECGMTNGRHYKCPSQKQSPKQSGVAR
jgi:hypothetical protein